MKRKSRIKRKSSTGLYRRARIRVLLGAKGIERIKARKPIKGRILKKPSKEKTEPIYKDGRRIMISSTGEHIYLDSVRTTGNSMSYVTTDGKKHTIKTPIRPSVKRVPKKTQKKTVQVRKQLSGKPLIKPRVILRKKIIFRKKRHSGLPSGKVPARIHIPK